MFILCLVLSTYFVNKLYLLSIQSAKNSLQLSQEKFEKQISANIHLLKTQYLSKSDLKDSYRYGVLFNNLERVENIFTEILLINNQQTQEQIYSDFALVDKNRLPILSSKRPSFLNKIEPKQYRQKSFTLIT